MTPSERAHTGSTLRDHARVLRRRKWMVIVCAVLAPAAAVGFSFLQQPQYEASAEVLLSRQNLAATLTSTLDPALYQQPERFARTQADLARVPDVAKRTIDAAHVSGMTPDEFLAASSVSTKTDSDLLVLKVTDPRPRIAVGLASAYAEQFTRFRLELDTAALERARHEVEGQIAQIPPSDRDPKGSSLYARLVDKQQELRTMEALQTSNAYVVRAADHAKQVSPRPVRNGAIGLVLGLLLGIGLAFLREALDTRVRTGEEAAERLGLPLLARLSEPPRGLRNKDRLAMLVEPGGAHAEAFRMLRTNLDFANLERAARTIMITSSIEGEGKSTTAANLAAAFARAGRDVVLVDLDLRRPYMARFFDLEHLPGLTDVALGRVTIDQALRAVPLTRATRGGMSTNGNSHAGSGTSDRPHGVLRVLPAGAIPPDPGEFVGTRVLAEILVALRERAELVIIDAPPLLRVGDSLTLSSRVDAVVVLTRLKVVRRGMLNELRRVIEACPAAVLGFIVTGAEVEEGDDHGYGPYYSFGYTPTPARERSAP